jgi:hypothetical protein
VSTRRLILYLVLAVAIAVAGFLGITAYSTRQPPVFENSAKLIAAMQAFARDHETLGKPLPTSVTIRELVDGGYLKATDVRVFEGMEVSLSFTADGTRPQEIMFSARLPDGTIHCQLADGSFLQVTEQAYRKQVSQQGGAANGSQPIRSETNRTSSAAGSRR